MKFITQDRRLEKRIFIKLEYIKNITPDALMYILAIVKSLKQSITSKCNFYGKLPFDTDCKELLLESGYLNYFRNKREKRLEITNDRIQIKLGSNVDGVVVKNICDFANEFFGTTQNSTKALYNMLIELMLNTTQHAYTKESTMLHQWYVFVERSADRIKITFLDTGEGIPKTVSRKIQERLIDISPIHKKNDSEYIFSALNKEGVRSSTKQHYRGKGLPKIYSYYKRDIIQNLYVISGKGKCIPKKDLNGNNILQAIENDISMNGTIFYWEIERP